MSDGAEICGDAALFGLRLRLQADSEEVFAASRALFDDAVAGADEIRLSLRQYTVSENVPQTVTDRRLRLCHDGFSLDADGARGCGELLYPAPDHPLLAEMIETAALFLAAQAGRTPLHASAVMFGDTALVLAGRSGMGKSSLALAASRAGLAVLSEDTVYVQSAPRLRVWARSRAIHVFENDAPPGAIGIPRFRSGRWKRALPLAASRRVAERAVLCLLAREGRVALEPLMVTEAVASLTAAPESGYDFYGERMEEAVRALAEGGCWRLGLGAKAADAVKLLQHRFGLAPA